VLVALVLPAVAAPATGQVAGTEWRTDIGFPTAFGTAISGHHALDSQGNAYATSDAWSYRTAKVGPTGELLWVREEPGGSGTHTQSLHLAVDSQDNCIVAGYREGPGGGFLTTKYAPDGTRLWSVITSHGIQDEGFRVGVDAEDNVYVTGRSFSPAWVRVIQTVKFDPDGNELWFRRFEALKGEPRAIAVRADGRVAVAGTLAVDDFGTLVYDAGGTLLWWDVFPALGGAEHVAMSPSGDVYVSGTAVVGKATGTVLHYDRAGGIAWIGTYDTPDAGWERFRRIALHPDGGVVAVGQGGAGYLSPSIVRFDEAGNVAWFHLVPDTNSNDGWATDVAVDATGAAYVTAFQGYQTWSSAVRSIAMKFDATGDLLWQYPMTCTGYSGSIALTADRSVIVSSGSHLIRVGEDPMPVSIAVDGNPIPLGGEAVLTLRAFDHGGAGHVAAAAFGTVPGIPTPHGNVPLHPDALFAMSLWDASGVFNGFKGQIPCDGQALASIRIPANPIASGLRFYVAFVAVPVGFDPPPWAISVPTMIEIQ
jgi:hypothetical protein